MTADLARLFFALWPGATVRGGLAAVQQRLPPDLGRAVRADNLHLTLVFLGATPASRRQCIERAVSGVRTSGFELPLDRLGYWRKPEVLWMGGSAPAPLAALVQVLQSIVLGCGGKADNRPFEAHLTLFRKVRRAPRPLPAVPPIRWQVESFVLVESLTDPAGAQYAVLREWPLGNSTSL